MGGASGGDKRQVRTREGGSDAYDVIAVGVVRCRITINGVEKQDFGQGDDAKSACSDSIKRAAVRWGIGRYLYDSQKLWGPLDKRGQIADPDQAKRRVLGIPSSSPQKRPGGSLRSPIAPSGGSSHHNGDLPF